MKNSVVTLESKGKVAVVTLNRPERKNAFDEAMYSGLEKVTIELNKRLPRVVVIVGAGTESFSSGFDVNPENPLVNDLLKAMESGQSESGKIVVDRIRKALDPFVSLPVPVIAAINGLAYGGGAELATRCDLRVMDQQAVICFSEVRLGLMPDMGGGVALTKLIGPSKAADLILSARKVKAEEALNLGLINRISLPGECLKDALELAETIADNGPQAVKSSLKIIRNASDLTQSQALKMEAETAAKLIATGECMVGVAAFLEKKKPEFPD